MNVNREMVAEFKECLREAGAGYTFKDSEPRMVGAIITHAIQPVRLNELFDESDDCHVLIGNTVLVDNHSGQNPVIYWDLKLFRA